MSILTQKKVLVLNKSWTPLGTITLQDAITKLFSTYDDGTPKARIIEPESYQTFTWSDWAKLRPALTDEKIGGANMFFRVPEVILLSKYEKLPKPKAHFSRRTLYKRDKLTCQYCGAKPGSEELTVEHILPRSKGGKTTWENCVLACVECNRKKRDRTPAQAGMKLLSVPKKPDIKFFRFDAVTPLKSWVDLIGAAYWNCELDNDNK